MDSFVHASSACADSAGRFGASVRRTSGRLERTSSESAGAGFWPISHRVWNAVPPNQGMEPTAKIVTPFACAKGVTISSAAHPRR
jgi:hypothetical protein